MQICHYRIFVGWLLVLACLAVGCRKRSSHLRIDGTVDLGDGVEMEFVWVQPGCFKMGSDEAGLDYAEERPAHDVMLTRPFYLGKYEVTQKQWLRVMKKNPSEFEGPDLPVEHVSWDEVQMFLKKLRKKTGENFVLPTEAQWEYACRADTTTRFSWGNSEMEAEDHAWFLDNSGRATHPVGGKKPNPWGLYDMSGNAWERCADSYGFYPRREVTDPLVSSPGGWHVVRGGGSLTARDGMHCSKRRRDWRRMHCVGFRCAIEVDACAR